MMKPPMFSQASQIQDKDIKQTPNFIFNPEIQRIHHRENMNYLKHCNITKYIPQNETIKEDDQDYYINTGNEEAEN